jgi:F-type H+-transporting ATPase subunit delta
VTSTAVVNRYANALADVVVGPAAGIDPAAAIAQLRQFGEVVAGSSELRTVLASPAVSSARKREVIRRLAERLSLEKVIRNFLLVLTDHRRAGALQEVIDAFDVVLDERLGFKQAEITSATELAQAQKDQLAAELERLAASKVRMKFSVDPTLIGGLTARVGSKVYDGSVRGQLAILRQRLQVN